MEDEEPTRYPLAWPRWKPRTGEWLRKTGQFKKDGSAVTRPQAVRRLEAEVARLGGKNLLISSDYPLKKNGEPLAAARRPSGDPGVCAYFKLDGKPYAMACDRYTQLAQNIAAVAAHIEATRAITRYGVATAAETLQSFAALPPPDTGAKTVQAALSRPWHEVMGVAPTASPGVVAAAYRALLKERHPDAATGSREAFEELRAAKAAYDQQSGSAPL